MRLRNVIILLLILPLLVWGGVKAFLWYSIDATFKQAQARLSDQADISYQDVRTSVMGPIGLTGITIRPKGSDDVIKVGSLLATWNEPKGIVPILEAFYKKSLPKELNLSANQIVLSLDSDLGDMITQPATWDWQPPISLPTSIWGCGNGAFQSADYNAMGYQRLELNARLEHSISAATGTLDFFLRVRNPDMMTVSLEGSIPAKQNAIPSLQQILSPELKLSSLSYSVDDESFIKKKISYCSQKSGESPSEFINSQIRRIATDLKRSNLYPSDELSKAYRNHLTNATRIAVNLDPLEPAGTAELAQLESANFVDWLGVNVLVADDALSELFVEREVATEEEKEEESEKPREETFNPTPITELGTHLSRLARVKTNDGKTHYAYIENAGPEMLILTQHLVGGSATFELEYSEIIEIAVLY